MVAGRKYIEDPWTAERCCYSRHSRQRENNYVYISFPCLPNFTEVEWKSPRGGCIYRGVVVNWGILSLRITVFYNSLQEIWLTSSQRVALFVLYWRVNKSTFCSEEHFLSSSKVVHYSHTLEKILQSKGWQWLITNPSVTWETSGELSLHQGLCIKELRHVTSHNLKEHGPY